MVPTSELILHAFWPRSVANGPGQRAVIWLQGCTLGCPGCFNTETHSHGSGARHDVDALADRLRSLGNSIEGVTLSGGEPLQQSRGVLALLDRLRSRTQLSVLMFSGYTLEEIRGLPEGPAIITLTDVLVDGRYAEAQRIARGLRGSSNQRIRVLSSRYQLAEIESTPLSEVRIARDGAVRVTGIAPPRLARSADTGVRSTALPR